MLPVQMRMARVALGLTVKQAAKVAGVAHDTITRIEAGEKLKESTLAKARAGLEAAGVQFIPENGGGAGVRLRKTAGTPELAYSSRRHCSSILMSSGP